MSSAKKDVWVEVPQDGGKSYYYNKKTRQTTWDKPASFIPAKKKAAPAKTAKISENKASDWREATDKSTGKKYYYNKKTKETVWRRPSIMGPAAGASGSGSSGSSGAAADNKAAAQPAANTLSAPVTSTGTTKSQKRQRTGTVSQDGKWEEVQDPSTGKKYWYNKQTHATAWVLPSSARQSRQEADVAELERNLDRRAPSPVNTPAQPAVVPQPVSLPTSAASPTIEKPANRMMKLKMALNDRTQTEIQEEEEEDDGGSFINDFTFAKHRHGFLNRITRTGEVFDVKQLLSFKKSLIKKALLKKNRRLDAEAIQSFKNIMSYMGDRKSSKPDNKHVQKLISNAMQRPADFRNEVYLQLIKQTTKNPRVASTVKGWELITFCLASFPPTKKLSSFLISTCRTAITESENQDIKDKAKDAINRIDRIISMGQRKQVPSEHEIQCLKHLHQVPVKINFINGTFKTIQVDSYTTVGEVEEQIQRKLGLILTTPFTLYEASTTKENVERILDRKDRILDVLAEWEGPNVEEKKEVIAHKKGGNAKTRTKVIATPEFDQFLYKAKLVLKTTNSEVMADANAVNLLYIQSIHEVITERYPCKERDLERLAALQLQATFGDYQPDAHAPGWLLPKLSEYLPTSVLGGRNLDQVKCNGWEQKILEKYSKISGFTSLEAKLNYLDYIQEWPFYGATFFMVEQRQFKDYPSPILLGITCEGVILMHPQKKTLLENYPFTDIVTWGHSDERFIVVVGNIVQQRKLIFKTQWGKNMNNLIHDYVKFKVQSRAT